MKPLEELKAILCECESVKRDVMELRFGCKILDKSRDENSNIFYITTQVAGGCDLIVSNEADDHSGYEHIGGIKGREFSDFNIVGNPIQDHHLRMYCVENGINLITNSYGEMATPDKSVIIELDLKPLSEQSDDQKDRGCSNCK